MLPDELAVLQHFPAKQRRELGMAILVAFKGLVGQESSPFHEAVPLFSQEPGFFIRVQNVVR